LLLTFTGSLVIMSLSEILLHFIHRGLKSKQGVSLGFLASGFQLNSLSYIFCKEFIFLELRYIGIFLGALVLAMISSLSSAIIMMPRLQFWTIDKMWISPGKVDFIVYIQANESSLYPNTLAADNAHLNAYSRTHQFIRMPRLWYAEMADDG
jgi:hypothetical protein